MQMFDSICWFVYRFGLNSIIIMANGLLIFGILAAITQHSLAVDCNKVPPRINPTSCCPIPELVTDESTDKCKEFLMPGPPTPTFVPMSNENPPTAKGVKPSPIPAAIQRHRPYMHWCFLECALNDTGIMEKGKLHEANLSALLKKGLKDTPDFIPELEKSFKTCSAKIEKHHLKMQEKIKNRNTKTSNPGSNNRMYQSPPCSPKTSHLMTCVFTETFVNCPATYWKKSKDCSELRDHMKDCGPKPYNSKEDSSSEERM